jgi:ABC-2 type transport system ATP-binding protein
MAVISVKHLHKAFKIHEKEPGLRGSIKALVTRQYRAAKAVDDISFSIGKGELVGFIGPNGAGKTTTLKCLSGLLYPSSGDISVLGYRPSDRKADFQRQFSLVMGQKNQLWWDLPPIETFLLHKQIYSVPDEQFNQTLNELVDLLQVKDILKIQVRKLSLGQRMKCELIAALLHNPKVLLLDEPTIGLDVVMQKSMRDFIKTYNRQYQSTIILTSHYMDDVKELCDRVIIIDQGRVIFDGKLNEIIDKYAVHKILTVSLSGTIDPKALEAVGIVEDYQAPVAKILVPRKQASVKATQLLSEFPVVDITIEEPPIEAIIRQVFKNNQADA